MKGSSKLGLLDIGKGHKKYMYKSWEIGSLWFNSTTKLYLIKMLLLSLCLHHRFFGIGFLAVDSTHALNISRSWSCRRVSVPLHGPYREERAGWTRGWSLTFFHRNSSFLQASTEAKQFDFFFCVWQEIELKWLRKCENAMNVVLGVGRVSCCCRHFALTWHVYKTVYILKV